MSYELNRDLVTSAAAASKSAPHLNKMASLSKAVDMKAPLRLQTSSRCSVLMTSRGARKEQS